MSFLDLDLAKIHAEEASLKKIIIHNKFNPCQATSNPL